MRSRWRLLHSSIVAGRTGNERRARGRRAATGALLLASSLVAAGDAGAPDLSALLSPTFPGTFLPVPLVRQSRNFTCGAAAVQGILGYFGEDFREAQLERILGTHPFHGTAVGKILEFWTAMGDPERQRALRGIWGSEELPDATAPDGSGPEMPFVRYRFQTFGRRERYDPVGPPVPDCPPAAAERLLPPYALEEDGGWPAVRRALDRGWPVLVALQAWARSPADYGGVRWDSGHYAVVVGYDDERVYFMDPSSTGNYVWLSRDQFLARWYDYDGWLSPSTGERCPGGHSVHRIGIAVGTDGPSPYRWSRVSKME